MPLSVDRKCSGVVFANKQAVKKNRVLLLNNSLEALFEDKFFFSPTESVRFLHTKMTPTMV